VVQDVFFDLWQRRATLPLTDNGLAPYLFGAVRNRVLQYLRHQHIVDRAALTPTEPLGLGAGPAAPDAEVTANDLHTAFHAALGHLSELQRSVLMLRWMHGLSYAEIAEALSISPNAAMHHASRTRHLIRPIVERFLGDIE
jgi:RNA polymerase sigma-70 factor (ECF subfamily)